MKIALVCTEKLPVPPVAGGAIQMYIDGILPYLSVRHDITVYCVQYPGLPHEEVSENVRYVRVPGKTQTTYIENVRASIAASVDRGEAPYDLVHVFNRPKFLLALSDSFPCLKFSLSLHNEMMHPEKITEAAGLKCIEKAEFINTVSRYIADTVTSRFPAAGEKMHVVYSGADPASYHPPWTGAGAARKLEMKSKYGLQDYRIILYVGRLSIKKGAHILIKAMEKVMQTHPDTALVIAGSKWYGSNAGDEYSDSLRRLVQRLPGPAVFTGFIPPSDIADYYCMGDIFVCASQWNEPLARVHYEAMAAGLPIITTNRGGNAEVMCRTDAAGTAVSIVNPTITETGCGIVIDRYKDPDVMADKIRFLLDNPGIAVTMGRKGRQLAEEKYNWKRVADEIFERVESWPLQAAEPEQPQTDISKSPQSIGPGLPQEIDMKPLQDTQPEPFQTTEPEPPQKARPELPETVKPEPLQKARPEPLQATESEPPHIEFATSDVSVQPCQDPPGTSEATDSPDAGTAPFSPDAQSDAAPVAAEVPSGFFVPVTEKTTPADTGVDPANISVIGTGYVGLVTGACLSSMGRNVVCCDQDRKKIKKLRSGIIPIYEPLLKDMVDGCVRQKRLSFTSNIKKAIEHSDIIFLTVSTPALPDGSCDIGNVCEAARSIGAFMDRYKIIVNKSTVPVGTGKIVREIISAALAGRNCKTDFDVVSNPEFLREGSAIHDFIKPNRIVIGAESDRAVEALKGIYSRQIEGNTPVLVTGIETAEMIKYASNAFLAAKISFVNELADLCEKRGVDICNVTRGMGLDSRIGPHFLNPGPGFGGSCFPKDVKAILALSSRYGCESLMLRSILDVNEHQKRRMVEKIEKALGGLDDSRITILGLSFKPGTDDIRESPAVSIIAALLERNASIAVFDPRAMVNMKREYPDMNLEYCVDVYSACSQSDCIVLATEWHEFSDLDFRKLKFIVKRPIFLDLRNVYEPEYVRSFGFYYEGVGRK